MPVLVVTGVAREAKLAAGPGVVTVCSGGSPHRLRTLLARQDPKGITAVISFGIAGGLNPALETGHVVVAVAIISPDSRRMTDRSLADALIRALSEVGKVKLLRATVAGAEIALASPRAKSAARSQTGAAVVDMESHIAADYAEVHGLPFGAVRVVCDPASDSLPPLVNEALNEDGSISYRGVFRSLCREPEQILDLLKLARTSRAAFGVLGRAGKVLKAAFAKA
jgi:hopanoid-associated phosphorylase